MRAQCSECGQWVEYGDPETEYHDHREDCPVRHRLESLEGYDLPPSAEPS